ncbi:MAG TPA: DNA polymerase III subunit delta [Acidimicrobiales bacterium]|nr:DNA polymerase III subunit delta [Acidimicrobiales bacterium]
MTTSAVLVKGADPALVAQVAHEAVAGLLEGRDPATCVEELAAADDLDVARLVDALTTPPFLVDRRVVVVRDAGRLTTADVERLAPVLADPPEGVAVVFVAGGGTLPPALHRALGPKGEVLDASVGASLRDRRTFVTQRSKASEVRLDAAAVERLTDQVGEDVARVDRVLDTLAAAYGPGTTITVDQLEPFLGATGAVPDWDLTDAITAGDAPGSLGVLHRLVGPGGRAAPVIVSVLQRHYLRLLRLDGAGARTKEAAASLLSISAYPAQKALAAATVLGSARIRQAVSWIAAADGDVKGMTGLEPTTVLEVLVARLARLHRAAGRAREVSPGRAGR